MKFTALGNSGCSVSAFALGTMTFGREASQEASFALLDHFVAAGGTLVDTADVYGSGASEEIIGSWLARTSREVRDQLVLATKARFPMGGGPNDVGLSRKHLGLALDASLRRLGVDTIDLYQVHGWDPLTPLEETLGFLADATRAGKILYSGVSNFTGWQLQRAVSTARAMGVAAPVSVQPQYNLLAREIEYEIIPAAVANGIGVLPWSPLAGGWLSGKYTRDSPPTSDTRLAAASSQTPNSYARRGSLESTWQVIDAVTAIARDRGVTATQVSLAWVAAQSGVTSVILGARTPEQLDGNLAALDLELSVDELSRLGSVSEPSRSDYPYGERGIEQRLRRVEGGR